MHANCCTGLERKLEDLRSVLTTWNKFKSLGLEEKQSLHSNPGNMKVHWQVPNACLHSVWPWYSLQSDPISISRIQYCKIINRASTGSWLHFQSTITWICNLLGGDQNHSGPAGILISSFDSRAKEINFTDITLKVSIWLHMERRVKADYARPISIQNPFQAKLDLELYYRYTPPKCRAFNFQCAWNFWTHTEKLVESMIRARVHKDRSQVKTLELIWTWKFLKGLVDCSENLTSRF
jgi:hypothetical protein